LQISSHATHTCPEKSLPRAMKLAAVLHACAQSIARRTQRAMSASRDGANMADTHPSHATAHAWHFSMHD
jgi:hypothetical protein